MALTRGFSLTLVVLLFSSSLYADDLLPPSYKNSYQNLVDQEGNIHLPSADFRTHWKFIGTWSVAEKDVPQSSDASGHGAAGLHNVYTQPDVIEFFQKNGSFPDGAVLIKELLKGVTASMTTGTVSRAGHTEGWFVMVKDTQKRFASNPLWGDGWGWALFNAGQPDKIATQNYRIECLGCHLPVRKNDWVYIQGYPLLRLGE